MSALFYTDKLKNIILPKKADYLLLFLLYEKMKYRPLLNQANSNEHMLGLMKEEVLFGKKMICVPFVGNTMRIKITALEKKDMIRIKDIRSKEKDQKTLKNAIIFNGYEPAGLSRTINVLKKYTQDYERK